MYACQFINVDVRPLCYVFQQAKKATDKIAGAINSLHPHELIAIAVKGLLGGADCKPNTKKPIPEKFTNMYSSGELYSIFETDGIPMAGPNCEYEAIIGELGWRTVIGNDNSPWRIKPTGLILAMEDMKDNFKEQVAALAFPELDSVDFAFDFSDLKNIQISFNLTLSNGKELAASIGGGKRARRAREKLMLRKSECRATLDDECGSEQTEAQCSTCAWQPQSKLAFAAAGCTEDEVAEYCRLPAVVRGHARARRDGNEVCPGECGDSEYLGCSGGKLFWAVVNLIAKGFDKVEQLAKDLEDAFQDAFGSLKDTIGDVLDKLPHCINDKGCEESCAEGKTCYCAANILDVGRKGWLQCHEKPEVGGVCSWRDKSCYFGTNTGSDGWCYSGSVAAYKNNDRHQRHAPRIGSNPAQATAISATSTTVSTLGSGSTSLASTNGSHQIPAVVDRDRRDRTGVCRAQALEGQFCDRGLGTPNNQYCKGDLKCGQGKKNHFNCCTRTALNSDTTWYCQDIPDGGSCNSDTTINAQCKSGWCEDYKCRPLGEAGEWCDGGTGSDAHCEGSLKCARIGTTSSYSYQCCSSKFTDILTKDYCSRNQVAGKTCSYDKQCVDNWCKSNKCKALGKSGEACDGGTGSDAQCEGSLKCARIGKKSSYSYQCCSSKFTDILTAKDYCRNQANGKACSFKKQCESNKCKQDTCKD